MPGTNAIGAEQRPAIRLKVDRLKAAARARQWATGEQLAHGLDVAPSSISRLTNRRNPPGEAFIAAVLATFGEDSFYEFFELAEPEPAALRSAA